MAKTPPKKGSGGSGSGSSGGGSKGSGGGGGGGGGIKKSNDKPQRDALKALLNGGLKKALTTELANIANTYALGKQTLLTGYTEDSKILGDQKLANDKAAGGASQGNLQNRARETADILANAAAQGAGETDTLRAKDMSLRNWAANQSDVDRSFFDTLTSNNAAVTKLNSGTKESLINQATDMLKGQETTYADYYNQMASTATQLGNLYSNPYSNAYSGKGAKDAYKKMKQYASAAWKSPGVSGDVTGWEGGLQPANEKINSSVLADDSGAAAQKRPEGSTLQAWG